ncbi:hypothetical protein B0H11DRAFT_1029320 [Mycena galericulata]|nr:hypothetical protein B0H11DRAFT_1029320 [Mycena galericulata]
MFPSHIMMATRFGALARISTLLLRTLTTFLCQRIRTRPLISEEILLSSYPPFPFRIARDQIRHMSTSFLRQPSTYLHQWTLPRHLIFLSILL